MAEIPSELRYTDSHEWVKLEGEIATVGITEHAQGLLGDMVFVELPELGNVHAGTESGVVESVKAASDIYAPLNGTIVEVNEALNDAPETVNTDPYGEGWLYKMKVENPDEVTSLMDADAYSEKVEEDTD